MSEIVRKKILKGVVVSDKMQGVVSVRVDYSRMHPLYKRTVRFSRKYLVKKGDVACKSGDLVHFFSTRPFSKEVSFALVAIDNR